MINPIENKSAAIIKLEKFDNIFLYIVRFLEKDISKFLSESNNVRFVDVSDTNCKKRIKTGGWHGITLTKCFADKDPRHKEINFVLQQKPCYLKQMVVNELVLPMDKQKPILILLAFTMLICSYKISSKL